jgi:hypothetical protein
VTHIPIELSEKLFVVSGRRFEGKLHVCHSTETGGAVTYHSVCTQGGIYVFFSDR